MTHKTTLRTQSCQKHMNGIYSSCKNEFQFIGDKGNERHGKHHKETITHILIMGHFTRQLVHSLQKVNVMGGGIECVCGIY